MGFFRKLLRGLGIETENDMIPNAPLTISQIPIILNVLFFIATLLYIFTNNFQHILID